MSFRACGFVTLFWTGLQVILHQCACKRSSLGFWFCLGMRRSPTAHSRLTEPIMALSSTILPCCSDSLRNRISATLKWKNPGPPFPPRASPPKSSQDYSEISGSDRDEAVGSPESLKRGRNLNYPFVLVHLKLQSFAQCLLLYHWVQKH